jgi:hypothetical protein
MGLDRPAPDLSTVPDARANFGGGYRGCVGRWVADTTLPYMTGGDGDGVIALPCLARKIMVIVELSHGCKWMVPDPAAQCVDGSLRAPRGPPRRRERARANQGSWGVAAGPTLLGRRTQETPWASGSPGTATAHYDTAQPGSVARTRPPLPSAQHRTYSPAHAANPRSSSRTYT